VTPITVEASPAILLAEDDPVTRMLMTRFLKNAGYEVDAVANGGEALDKMTKRYYPILVTDWEMPEMDGVALCKAVRNMQLDGYVYALLLTARDAKEHIIAGLEAGADDFLNKPIFSEELFARVKSLLKLKEFTDELETAESVLCTLGLSVEARDPYTEGHCERLAKNASDLGTFLGLDEESLLALRRGGYLHDLGKISVPDEILKKGTDLTEAEWAIMKQHPVTGEAICRPLKSLRLVLPIIRHHHEHSDGSGYPDGLHDKEIPLLPRILQVVDIYDALRTARPYKPAFGHGEAAITMRHEAEIGLWDKELVAEFLSMLEKRRQAA